MFCNQCEQTARGIACTVSGVCGKVPAVADIQDRLVYSLRLLARTALKARAKGSWIRKSMISRYGRFS